MKKFALVLLFLLTASHAFAAISMQKIIISEDTELKTGGAISGVVTLSGDEIEFTGVIDIKKDVFNISIAWTKAKGKNIKSGFYSKFKSNEKSVKKGTKLNIFGDFKALSKTISENQTKDDTVLGQTEDPFANDSTSGSESSSNSSDTSSSNGSGSSGSQPLPSPTDPGTTTDPDTQTEDTPNITYEACSPEIVGSTVQIREREVKTYSDKTEKGACVVKESYTGRETTGGCEIRHDFTTGKSYQQSRIIYFDYAGEENQARACNDSGVTYAHQTMVSDCEKFLDPASLTVYLKKKTYITDSTGSIQFVSGCKIDQASGVTISSGSFEKEFSDEPRIDYDNNIAYNRFRYYYLLGESNRVYLSEWQDDLMNPIPISKKYNSCPFYHDNLAGKSYRQYQLGYLKDGQEVSVTQCSIDENFSFNHITDDNFCYPKMYNKKLMKMVSTYFLDDTGHRQTVKECAVTDQEIVVQAQDIEKDFTQCDARLDLINSRAIGLYKEKYVTGNQSYYISGCTEDPTKIYPVLNTNSGCVFKIDLVKNEATQRERKYYNDGRKDNYVTDCQETTNVFPFDRSTSTCEQQLSIDKTKIVENEEIFFRDGSGIKHVVQSCSPNGVTHDLPEGSIVKEAEGCGYYVNFDAKQAFRKYKTYINVSGKLTLKEDCKFENENPISLQLTDKTCTVRADFINSNAIIQKRWAFVDNGEDHFYSACLDSAETIPFVKDTGNCTHKISEDKLNVIEYEETYYIDRLGVKQPVQACTPNGKLRPIAENDIIRDYEACSEPMLDIVNDKLYPQYKSFIYLNGENQLLRGCAPDYEKAYALLRDYDSNTCDYKIDVVDKMEATKLMRLYYKNGSEDVYISDCIESDITYPIEVDKLSCDPLPVAATNKVIFREKRFFLDNLNKVHVLSFDGDDENGCYPTANQASVETVLCDGPDEDLYSHNFLSGQSFYNTKSIYTHVNGNEIEVNPCSPDPALGSFPHNNEFCGYVNNDAGLQAIAKSRKYFKNDKNEVFYFSGCEASAYPLSYVYVGDSYTTTKDGQSCTSNTDHFRYKVNSTTTYQTQYRTYQRPDSTTFKKYAGSQICNSYWRCESCACFISIPGCQKTLIKCNGPSPNFASGVSCN